MNKVLYFTSPGCGVCVDLKPKVQAMVENNYPKLVFELVDTSEHPEKAGQYGVFTAPTLLVFFEGKETHRFVRNMSIQEIEQKVGRLYQLYFS